ncbi:hypothetical protein ACJW30_01G158000 [Castanea mollissima]
MIMYHENFLIITTYQIRKIVNASLNRSTIEPNQITKFKTLHFSQKVFSIIIYSTQSVPPPSEPRISHYNEKCLNTKHVLVPHSIHKIPHDLILPNLFQRPNYGVISPDIVHVIFAKDSITNKLPSLYSLNSMFFISPSSFSNKLKVAACIFV